MSKVEDLLYTAYEQGKRIALLKKVEKIRKTTQKKYLSTEDLYEEAFQELVKEGIISE